MSKIPMSATSALVTAIAAVSWPTGSGAQSPYAQIPSAAQFNRFYPERAMNRGIEGSAVIDCVVDEKRVLKECVVVSESPSGWGFGDASLKLSALFRVKETASVGQHMKIPINWTLSAAASQEMVVTGRALAWAKQPSADDLDKVRPAAFAGPGDVTLRCHVKSAANLPTAERGTLYDCKTVKEVPAKAGFGAAAQSAVPLFQFDGATLSPMPSATTVDIDMSWAPKSAG